MNLLRKKLSVFLLLISLNMPAFAESCTSRNVEQKNIIDAIIGGVVGPIVGDIYEEVKEKVKKAVNKEESVSKEKKK